MFVENLLPLPPERLVVVAETAPLIQAAAGLRTGIDLVVICRADRSLAGVVTKTNIVEQISKCQGASCTCAVSTVMTRDVLLCHSDDSLAGLWLKMKDRGIKNVPLVDVDLKPLAIVTARDLLQVLLKEAETEELLLRDYVMGFGWH